MSRRAAFTLLETLVVVTLLSLLLVVGAWGISGIRSSQGPRSLGEELAGQVQHLRSLAQSQETCTALAWATNEQGLARSCFLLEGTDRARLLRQLPWHRGYPDVVAFCGQLDEFEHWPPAAELTQGARDLPSWAGAWSGYPMWVFTPSGEVVGLNWPQRGGRYRCVLARGATAVSASLEGRPVARLQSCHKALSLEVMPTGGLTIDNLKGSAAEAGPGLTIPGPMTIPVDSTISPLRITELHLEPQQNPELEAHDGQPQRARVEPEAYLHFRVRAQGSGPGPLTCLWSLPQLRGRTSAAAATTMVWNGQHYESTWEWQAPSDSLPGDRISISCQVRDGLGREVPSQVEASVDVEIIKTGRVLFSSLRDGQPDLYMVNQDGSRLRRLTRDPQLEGRPHLSPDGTRMFYAKNGQLLLGDAQGQHLQVLLSGGSFIEPVWNPLGTRIAVNRRRAGVGDELCLIDADPLHPQVEVVGTFPIEELGFTDWSPDNSRLVYNRVEPGGGRLYEYIFAGARHRPLRPVAGESEIQPRFSPDGQQLAVTRRNRGEIWVSRYRWDSPDGDGRLEDEAAVVTGGIWNSDPAWSPDGEFLVFGSRRPGGNQDDERVWVQSLNSTQARRLSTPGNSRDWDPTWGR